MIPLAAALLCAAPFDAAWARALPAGAEVTLPSGDYQGPWTLGGGIRIHGSGATLKAAADGSPTIDVVGSVRIDGLAIAAPPKGFGVRIEKEGAADLRGVTLSGPGQALLFVAEGALTLSGGQLKGGDYGVLTQQTSRLEIRGATVRGQSRAGLAVVSGEAVISDVELDGPFGEAAITVIHAKATLQRNRISHAGSVGIKIVNGEAVLIENTVSGGRSDPHGLEGNGLSLFDSTASLTRDRFSDCQGASLSLIGSRTTMTDVIAEGSAEAAVYLSQGTLTAKGCVVRHSPAGILLEPKTTFDGAGFKFEKVEAPLVMLQP